MARVVDEIIKPNQIYNDGHRFKNHLFFIPFQLDLRVDFEFFDAVLLLLMCLVILR